MERGIKDWKSNEWQRKRVEIERKIIAIKLLLKRSKEENTKQKKITEYWTIVQRNILEHKINRYI